MDEYESPKILAGPWSTAAARPAMEALRADVRYRRLLDDLGRAGLFAPAGLAYAIRGAAIFTVYACGYALIAADVAWWLSMLAAVVVGMTHIRGNFLAHDAAHGAATKRPVLVECMGQVFDSLLGGYAFHCFRRAHDLHHYHCNEIHFDPDTISPWFSVNAHSASTKVGFGQWLSARQFWVLPMLFPLWAFAFRIDALAYAMRNWRNCTTDLVLVVVHHVLWLPVLASSVGWITALTAYLVMSGVAGIYLAAIIPVNHVGMPHWGAEDLPFVEQQVAASRNIATSALGSWLFLGLDSQVEHHLVPWAPHFRLRSVRTIVKQFCADYDLPYEEVSYVLAFKQVFQHLTAMASVTRDLTQVDERTAKPERTRFRVSRVPVGSRVRTFH